MSQRCLDYWDEKGIVSPSATAASGKGTVRRYAFEDLLKLAVVKRLRATGLSLQRIRKGVIALRKRLQSKDVLGQEFLVTDGEKLYRIRENGNLEDVLEKGQMVLSVVALGRVHEEVSARILQMERAVKDSQRRKRPAI